MHTRSNTKLAGSVVILLSVVFLALAARGMGMLG